MADKNDVYGWDEEDAYWTETYRSRPYVSSNSRGYGYYRPGYRYGYEAAGRYKGREWNEVESDLSRSWNSYEHRGTSTWEARLFYFFRLAHRPIDKVRTQRPPFS